MLYKLAEYSKFLLPICFFGYAAVANIGLVVQLSEKTGELLNINQQEIQRLRENPVELHW